MIEIQRWLAGAGRSIRKPAPLAGSLLLSAALSACMVKPQPLTDAELSAKADESLRLSYAEQEPVRRPIDLGEAMARAVMYNLDQRVQRAEQVLKSKALVSANMAMLPGLVANAGYTGRNNVEASTSYDVYTGQQSVAMSTSVDQALWESDAQLSWNILDLGLSYVRAQQAADETLANRELRRKVLAKVVEDVRTAYWKALAAEYLARDLAKLEQRARTSLAQSKQLVDNANVSPLTALAYQKEIYEIQDRLQLVEAEVLSAKAQLASLINLPPGTRFSLVRPGSSPFAALPDERTMLQTALRQRPEVREAIYKERIADLDGRAVLLDTLPGINVVLAPNYNSNSFSLHDNWWKFGAQASWNLMKVFSYPAREAEAQANTDLQEQRLKALTASVALQVVVGRQRYDHARKRLQTAADFRSVQQQILQQLAASATAARSGEQELVREEMSGLLARARYDVALAEVQSAYAALQTTMGRDPYPDLDTSDLAALSNAFRKSFAAREPLVVREPGLASPPARASGGGGTAEVSPAAPKEDEAKPTQQADLRASLPGGPAGEVSPSAPERRADAPAAPGPSGS